MASWLTVEQQTEAHPHLYNIPSETSNLSFLPPDTSTPVGLPAAPGKLARRQYMEQLGQGHTWPPAHW